jgi:hypothetical protein
MHEAMSKAEMVALYAVADDQAPTFWTGCAAVRA